MAELTRQAVDEVVRDMNAYYQPDNDACGRSTPAQMKLLIERLADYTKRVKDASTRYKLLTEYMDPWTGEIKTTGSTYNAQFALDMANWEQRLAHYRRVVEQTPSAQASTKSGCEMIYKQTTGPLLDGIWYEVLPGIVLSSAEKQRMASGTGHPQTDVPTTIDGVFHPGGHSNPKPPDVITPFTLGNQMLVWKDHQDEMWREFWQDLKKAALAIPSAVGKELAKLAKPFGQDFLLPIGVTLLGLSAATIVGLVIFTKVKTSKLRRDNALEGRRGNPRRLR